MKAKEDKTLLQKELAQKEADRTALAMLGFVRQQTGGIDDAEKRKNAVCYLTLGAVNARLWSRYGHTGLALIDVMGEKPSH